MVNRRQDRVVNDSAAGSIVTVVYRCVPQYRREFYSRLRASLAVHGVTLRLLYGLPGPGDRKKMDSVNLDWAEPIRNVVIRIFNKELYWQSCHKLLSGSSLVIVEQASKLILNYLLILEQIAGLRRVAFWGHGKNFQANQVSRLAECIKRYMSKRVHWWFAYNDTSAAVVESLGYPVGRITSVRNSIDVLALQSTVSSLSAEDVNAVRKQFGLENSQNVCLFIGGMYPEKRLDFLIKSTVLIHDMVPDFVLLMAGAGQSQSHVERAVQDYSWIRYVGPIFDEDRVPLLVVSKAILMPGLVGLVVLDSLATGTPLVTTRHDMHSPEIEYFVPGVTGVMVEESDSVEAYAGAVAELLMDAPRLNSMRQACMDRAQAYSLEEMVNRFTEGILDALVASRR